MLTLYRDVARSVLAELLACCWHISGLLDLCENRRASSYLNKSHVLSCAVVAEHNR